MFFLFNIMVIKLFSFLRNPLTIHSELKKLWMLILKTISKAADVQEVSAIQAKLPIISSPSVLKERK